MNSKKERFWSRAWRGAKILFFVANMLASLFLTCAPPLLIVLLDLLLPSALLAAASGPALSFSDYAAQIRSYRYRASLVDLPLVSVTRSMVILCFYLFCGGRGLFLGVATLCASISAGFVSMKAIAMFGADAVPGKRQLLSFGEKEGPAVEALFLASLALAMAHVMAAYRISCRERRKLLVYKIDIEAVSAYKNEFSNYHKIALSE
ncbi:uncharacterized protein LOC110032985 [Phalaenopsis equestris]|uniref:uncharacterized protein LOC110032985 n=1 Tax=Phalaenopsis equestris TaxID=78828 RepID=UPI0009E3C811|nr:uncharacterized protein LOC110032985 [Phalaenopsis equestris]